MTWPYRELVLDLEPQGPLPPEIYRRRRMLAIGVAALVVVIVVAIVVVVISNVTGEAAPATKPTATAAQPTPLPGENPEVKSPVLPPAPQAPPPTPTPTAAVTPPPVLKEGDDCPDSTLAVKGITSQPDYVVGDQPEFRHGHQHRSRRLQARRRRSCIGGLRLRASQHAAVVQPGLCSLQRDPGQDDQPG